MGAKPEEIEFTNVVNAIVDRCKEYLVQNRDEIERYDLEMNDLKSFNPLYWKKEKGKIVEGKGPMLYVKCMMGKKNENITTTFIDDETNEEIDPFDIMSKYCYVTGAIRFESIFIGNKISLQLKLYEAVVRVVDMGVKKLLRPRSQPRFAGALSTGTAETAGVVTSLSRPTMYDVLQDDDENEDDEASVSDGDDDDGDAKDWPAIPTPATRSATTTSSQAPLSPPPKTTVSATKAPAAPRKKAAPKTVKTTTA
jgi:hypothetical protein